ncbi:hypothetical protein ACSMFR_05890 [Listeria aquatica]|uniref:hypothetical protein n=1 Tax=Listeria aquatica TaxID=1494960 RepID=UPI003F72CFC2
MSEGDEFLDVLYGFTVKNIMKDFGTEYVIDKKEDRYHIHGQLVDKEFLQIGEFKIDISDGDIPKDIERNDHIEVDISRVDIF